MQQTASCPNLVNAYRKTGRGKRGPADAINAAVGHVRGCRRCLRRLDAIDYVTAAELLISTPSLRPRKLRYHKDLEQLHGVPERMRVAMMIGELERAMRARLKHQRDRTKERDKQQLRPNGGCRRN